MKTLSCEVGDPQTYTLAALFSFQGTNVNPKRAKSGPTALGGDRL
ncbi:MAG TPA: hypothetical protein VKR56_02380 [Candidatus Cybelea sp.]|nr:hypothetical protein [Candidatus Cybelea sp.]